MNPVVVIPRSFYPRRHRGGADVVSTYDHPTAPNQEGELGRCLESLAKVEGLGLVVILVSADVSLEVQAAEKVQAIANRHPDVTTLVIGAGRAGAYRAAHGPAEHRAPLQRDRPSRLRRHPQFGPARGQRARLRRRGVLGRRRGGRRPEIPGKAMYGLGKLTRQGVPIVAKTGYYLNDQDSYLSKWEDKWYNRFWQQGRAFNEWITKAMRGPRLSRSNHVRRLFGRPQEAFRASPLTRGSPAARIWTTCSICACTARISGSTTSGSCVTCPAHRKRGHAFPPGHLPVALRVPQAGILPSAHRPSAGEAGLARALPGAVFGAGSSAPHSAHGMDAQLRTPRQEGLPPGRQGRHGCGFGLCRGQLREVLRVPVRLARAMNRLESDQLPLRALVRSAMLRAQDAGGRGPGPGSGGRERLDRRPGCRGRRGGGRRRRGCWCDSCGGRGPARAPGPASVPAPRPCRARTSTPA